VVVFGSSAFFLPVVIHFMSKNQALGLMSFFQVISNTLKFGVFFRKINWKIVLYFGLPSLVLVGVGSYLAKFVDANLFRIILGWVLLGLVVLELLHNYQLPQNPVIEFIGGTISGFVSGLVGTGGAIRGYFIFNFNLPKEVLIATYCVIDYSGDTLRWLVYMNNGFLDNKVWSLAPWAVLATIIANIIGILILKYIPVALFKGMLILTLLVLSILMIFGV
jgi:uncharacterized protein